MIGLGTVARRARLALVFVACACDHDPIVERRGDPMPDPDASVMPPPCDQGAGGEGGVPATPIRFCQAEIVLRTVCQRCHQEPPLHGAPFALVTYEDTQEPYGSTGKLRWQRMREVVEIDFMPLMGIRDVPVDPLTCEEKSTLMGWLNQCALPEGGTDCEGRTEELVSCE
jgi:hypothetical protein